MLIFNAHAGMYTYIGEYCILYISKAYNVRLFSDIRKLKEAKQNQRLKCQNFQQPCNVLSHPHEWTPTTLYT